ncbi:MAG: flagellar assembly protein FliW [Oscillospiraceae bacterium]|nr:flagellar assembly protein FliW [Oscillospiraceae bacterium]
MKIVTRDFGEIEIDDSTIISIPNGILGFEDTKRYTLLSPLGEDTFPMWLQSVDGTSPCFVVYDPMLIYSDYRFEITDEEQALLKIDENTPYRCLAVAIVPDDYRKTTINLRCPIVINTKDSIAAQIILEDYDFKCPVYSEEYKEA